MALFEMMPDPEQVLAYTARLRRHHDHLKGLDTEYEYMRRAETYDRMKDPSFRCDPSKFHALREQHSTSVILKLSGTGYAEFFSRLEIAYEGLKDLVKKFDSRADVEIYSESAHITIKSLLDGEPQNEDALRVYLQAIAPTVDKWIRRMAPDTTLYAIGLFTNLHEAKGLSVGVRFYPSLPLIQVLRGEIGSSLYESGMAPLRPESSFHTMLTHSTGFRARDLTLPMSPEFIQRFEEIVAQYDNTVFGTVGDIEIGDIYIRNGKSDKLITYAEVSLSDTCQGEH